jgi:O-antigen/teichoic acid export membrane protein
MRPAADSGSRGQVRGAASGRELSLRDRLMRGAAGAFTINVAGAAVAFLAQLVCARALGAQSYGIYAYVNAWITVLSLLTTLGFQTGLLRFASAYVAREEWGLLRGVVRYVERRVILAGAVLAAVGAATIWGLGDRLGPELAHTFLIGLAVVPALALLQVLSSLLRALGRVVAALAPGQLVRQLTLLLVVVPMAFGITEIGAPLAMALTLAGALIGLWLVRHSLRRATPAAMAAAPLAEERAVWRSAAAFLLLMAGAQVLMRRTDVLMLGWFAGTTEAGIYAVASRLAELVSFALTAVNIIFAPTISALYARGDGSGLQSLVTTTAWWVTICALVIAAPLFVFAGTLLWLFGEPFVAGAMALRILLLGQLVNAAAGSVSYLMTMTGQERHAALIIVAATLGNICANMILIPAFGMAGAAVANAVTVAAWNIAMALFLWRRLRIVPTILGHRRWTAAERV